MRRIVFLVLIIGLLACSQLIVMLATHAAAKPGLLLGHLKVASLDFYYKQDENARFLDLKTQWQSANRGVISAEKIAEIAAKAYQQSSVEAVLPQWRYQGGPAPKTFSAKLHLFNTTHQAILNTVLSVTLQAKVGDLRVSPATQLTDYQYLESSGRWEPILSKTVSIAAIAPDEDQQVELFQFALQDFLNRHPNRWPSRLKVTVSSPRLGVAQKELRLIPDHFIVPSLY